MRKHHYTYLFCLMIGLGMLHSDPFIIIHQNTVYWPWFISYIETDFGGTFSIRMDYHDPSSLALIKDAFIMPYGYGLRILPCHGGMHLLGMLYSQQDLLTYALIAIINTLVQSTILTVIAVLSGNMIGILIGYYHPKYQIISQCFIDVCRTVPFALILIIRHQSAPLFILFFTLTQWAKHVGQARNQSLRIINQPYLIRAKLNGLSDRQIIKQHYIPQITHYTIPMLPHTFLNYLSMITSLNYFGITLDNGYPSIGSMLRLIMHNPNGPYITILYWFTFILVVLVLSSYMKALQK